MIEFKEVNEILDFAIDNEQKAFDFYTSLALNARNDEMKLSFQNFAKEEMGHKARLMKIKETGMLKTEIKLIEDMKISDYIIGGDFSNEMSYQDALILAMKREKASFKLYMNLASKTKNKELADVFRSLAIEESKHKLSFEIEYDDFVLREN